MTPNKLTVTGLGGGRGLGEGGAPPARRQPLAPPADGPGFRPFTPDEVVAVTRVPVGVLEGWLPDLPVRTGDDKRTQGLDYVQLFAVYCAWRWLEEGAGADRAGRVLRFVAGFDKEAMFREWAKGNTFPQLAGGAPRMLVRPPATGRAAKLGRALNLRRLHREFRHHLRRVFKKD